MSLPLSPFHSNSRESLVSSPAINPVRVCRVTRIVPESTQKHFGTVVAPVVLVFVKGAKFLSVVNGKAVSCRNHHRTEKLYE